MRACWTLTWCNKSRENYNSYQCLIDTYFMISAILHHTLPLRVMLSVLKTKHHRTIHDILKQQIETSNNAYINAKNQEDNTKNVFIFSFSSVKTFLCSNQAGPLTLNKPLSLLNSCNSLHRTNVENVRKVPLRMF